MDSGFSGDIPHVTAIPETPKCKVPTRYRRISETPKREVVTQ